MKNSERSRETRLRLQRKVESRRSSRREVSTCYSRKVFLFQQFLQPFSKLPAAAAHMLLSLLTSELCSLSPVPCCRDVPLRFEGCPPPDACHLLFPSHLHPLLFSLYFSCAIFPLLMVATPPTTFFAAYLLPCSSLIFALAPALSSHLPHSHALQCVVVHPQVVLLQQLHQLEGGGSWLCSTEGPGTWEEKQVPWWAVLALSSPPTERAVNERFEWEGRERRASRIRTELRKTRTSNDEQGKGKETRQ
eukprot:755173-Hanusia_phi.AAC.1